MIKLCTGKELSVEVNIEDLIKQLSKESNATKLAEVLLTHPYIVNRIKSMVEFSKSDQYKKISCNEFDRENDAILKILKATKIYLGRKKNIETIKNDIMSLSNDFVKISKTLFPDKSIIDVIPEVSEDGDLRNEPNDEGKIVTTEVSKPQLNGDLYNAVIKGNTAAVEDLLNKGAELNFQDKDGDTPMHLAVTITNMEIIKLLLAHGAYIDQPNYDGETPVALALKRNRPDIAKILKQKSMSYIAA
jgi:hypothetical protein